MSYAIEQSTIKASNAARIWYVPLMVCSIFGILYVDSRFIVDGNASATMTRILAAETLYRLGIAAFLAGQVSQIFVMLALYRMFKPVDRDQAAAMFAIVVAMIPVAFVNMVDKIAPVILLKDPVFGQIFQPAQREALAMLLVDLSRYGMVIVEVFWGLWLIPLGRFVYKSGWFPKVLGILLFVAGTGYMAGSFAAIVLPDTARIIAPVSDVMAAGEVVFVLWLLIFGVKNPFRRRT